MPHGALAQLSTQQGSTSMDPSAPGGALAQFLHPWDTPVQGCRAFHHLAKPLWLPVVCKGFSPLSWRRVVALEKPFLRNLEQGWQLRCAVRESLCLPTWPPVLQRVVLSSHHSSLSPLDTYKSLGRGTHCQHKTAQGSADHNPSSSSALPALPRQQQHFQWPVPCTGAG